MNQFFGMAYMFGTNRTTVGWPLRDLVGIQSFHVFSIPKCDSSFLYKGTGSIPRNLLKDALTNQQDESTTC